MFTETMVELEKMLPVDTNIKVSYLSINLIHLPQGEVSPNPSTEDERKKSFIVPILKALFFHSFISIFIMHVIYCVN